MRVRAPAGGWGPWTGLGGRDIRETLVAVVVGGRTDLFAVTNDQLLRWRRATPAGKFSKPRELMRGTLDGTLGVARTPAGLDGPVLVGHADGATVTVAREDGTSTVAAGGGTGAFAGLLRDGRLHLLRRNDQGRVDVSDAHTPGERPVWHPSGVLFTGAPAVAVDAAGVAYAATVGVDGRLWTCRLGGPAAQAQWTPAPGPAALPAQA
jgi:hypothetical protein